jgi:invasion protein IalB
VLGAVVAGGLLALPAAAQAQTQQPVQPQPVQPQPVQPQAPQGQPPVPADPETTGQVFGDWVERCTPTPPPGASPPAPGEQNVCFIMQQVMDQNTQRPLLKITVGFFGQQRQVGAVIAMPLGVPLARGLEISVDGKEVRTVPFQICRRDGCQAYMLMDDAAVGAFKAGSQAQARVASAEDEAINLPISLKGFTAGFGAIQ